MTPPRLTEIECPSCHKAHWIIDSDYRGADLVGGIEETHPERIYRCPACGDARAGWAIRQQSPPEFLLQPHDMYPMTHAQFDYWVAVLRAQFPGHPILRNVGSTFFPRTPEEVAIRQEADARSHPVVEMRDQDGARRHSPDFRDASEWLEMMRPGDVLLFVRRDGGHLQITEERDGSLAASYVDRAGGAIGGQSALDAQQVRTAIRHYLDGDTPGPT
jgi:hypothetical protein